MKSKITTILCALGAFLILNACHGSKKVQCDSYGQNERMELQDLASK